MHMHGARTRALHTSRRGPAIIILISISLPRFRRRDRARSVQVQVQVRRDPTRVAAGTVPPSRGGSRSGRRGCWGPSLLGIDVKPAASAVPSTRPDSFSRFFHTCRAIWNARGTGQSSNACPHVRGCCGYPIIAAHIFRIRSLHVHPARQLASADGRPR